MDEQVQQRYFQNIHNGIAQLDQDVAHLMNAIEVDDSPKYNRALALASLEKAKDWLDHHVTEQVRRAEAKLNG